MNIDGTPVELKYSKSAGGYSGTITTSAANTAITVTGTGSRFDITTGTDAGIAGITYPFCLVPSGSGSFEFINAESTAESFVIENAGTYTLTFNVSEYIWTLKEGAEEPPVVTYPENVAIYYYLKDASDPLGLACQMAETADEGIFEGFVWTDPNWGTNYTNFRFHADDVVFSSNSDGQYVLGEGGWNSWSSNSEMNYVVADFTTMTWSETKVTKIAITGDFNSWSLDADQLTFNMETGKWEAECDITYIEWGIQFVLDDANGTWRWKYMDGDMDGILSMDGGNIMPAQPGKYKIELDLSSFSAPVYTMTLIE